MSSNYGGLKITERVWKKNADVGGGGRVEEGWLFRQKGSFCLNEQLSKTPGLR